MRLAAATGSQWRQMIATKNSFDLFPPVFSKTASVKIVKVSTLNCLWVRDLCPVHMSRQHKSASRYASQFLLPLS